RRYACEELLRQASGYGRDRTEEERHDDEPHRLGVCAIEATDEDEPRKRQEHRNDEACDLERTIRWQSHGAEPTQGREARCREQLLLVLRSGVGFGAVSERNDEHVLLESGDP